MFTYVALALLLQLLKIPLAIIDLTEVLLPSEFADALVEFMAIPYIFEPLFPVELLYSLMLASLTFEVLVLFYKSGMWFFDIIRHMIRG